MMNVEQTPKKTSKLKIVAITLATIVLLFVGVVATRPSEFRISRSITIAAPPEDVFKNVNDLHKWEAWSPWAKLDPASKLTFDGSTAGQGALLAWDGNEKVGKGRMTIAESKPEELVLIRVDFEKPFVGNNMSEFQFKTAGDQTTVNWSMYGHNDFVGRAICMFMNMDKMLGGDMDKGLSQMKTVVEAEEKK